MNKLITLAVVLVAGGVIGWLGKAYVDKSQLVAQQIKVDSAESHATILLAKLDSLKASVVPVANAETDTITITREKLKVLIDTLLAKNPTDSILIHTLQKESELNQMAARNKIESLETLVTAEGTAVDSLHSIITALENVNNQLRIAVANQPSTKTWKIVSGVLALTSIIAIRK